MFFVVEVTITPAIIFFVNCPYGPKTIKDNLNNLLFKCQEFIFALYIIYLVAPSLTQNLMGK